MIKKLFFICLVCVLLTANLTALAEEEAGTSGQAPTGDSGYALENPLGNNASTVQLVIENIIKALLGLVGVIALIMFILGGFKVMTAAGDGKKVQTGFHTMLWAAVGLILIFASRLLLTAILGAF